MTVRKVISNDLKTPATPPLKRKHRYIKHGNLSKVRVIIHISLLFVSLIMSINITTPDGNHFAQLTVFSVTLSTLTDILQKTRFVRESTNDMKSLFKKLSVTLKCSTITCLNVYFYKRHNPELVNVFLIIPTLFMYLVIWRLSFYDLVELFFPFTCLFIMYNCYKSLNIFGAVAALLNSWAYYTKNNFKLVNEFLDSLDMYNILMCFFVWFCYEAVKFEGIGGIKSDGK